MNASVVVNAEKKASAVDLFRVRFQWVGWLPLAMLPATVVLLAPASVPRWVLMWLLAATIYLIFKWLSWSAAARPPAKFWRKACWWLAWPGMNVGRFLADPWNPELMRPSATEWFAVAAKTLAGVGLFALGVLLIDHGWECAGGWCGMVGIVLILHFGAFHCISCAYRAAGIDAPPIMDRPLASQSLGEFWGRRWNRAFRDASYTALFRPVARRWGAAAAMWAVFLFSGVIHEVCISIPAGAGFGLPTLYFVLQAAALMTQNSNVGKRVRLGRGQIGWSFTLLAVFGPIAILFHPPFVELVVVPMMKSIGSL